MTGPVLVVGATGNVGGATASALLRAGVPVRAAGTDPAAVARRLPAAEPVRLDLRDPGTFAAAVRGASGLLLVRPPAVADVGRTLNPLLDAAQRHGVEHVVFSSVTGADRNRLVPHHRVERHLRASRMGWTILRPGFFAQNLADAYRRDIVEDDRVVVPAGDGRVAFVDTRDVGDAAAAVLADPAAHRGAAYVLTGGEALGFAEVADVLTRELGRTVRYRPASVPGYVRHLRRAGLPVARIAVQTVLHADLRRGGAAAVDPTLGRLLRRAPRSLAQYVHDHRATWASRATVDR